MHTIAAFVITSPLLTAVYGSPLVARGNTCGTAPKGSSSYSPLSQPSNIQTAAACQAQCNALSTCQSFCFGMVDSAIQCKLYSCAAAEIPPQSSANLIAYDKACSSVPAVVPTSSNPTGVQVSGSSGQQGQQTGQNGQNGQSGQTGQNGQTGQSSPQQGSGGHTRRDINKSLANTCAAKPAANTSNQPISAPSAQSVSDCKAKCQADSSCQSFCFGNVNNVATCKLYSCAASAIPAPSDSASKNALVAYDVGCSI